MTELRPFISHRTYPQPDAPELKDDARFRALAVFKYLLNLEPEEASRHKMFACIEHAFQQQIRAALSNDPKEMRASKVELISGAPPVRTPARREVEPAYDNEAYDNDQDAN